MSKRSTEVAGARSTTLNGRTNGTRKAEPPQLTVDGDRAVDLEQLSREQLVELLQEQGAQSGIRINFSGKGNARTIWRRVRPRVQTSIAKYSSGDASERAKNLIMEGDNLQGMVTLYRERGQVDFIIADPPYNTGKDFRYNDRWDDDPNDPDIGEFVAEDESGRHTKWMRFMLPRLQVMKAMLKPSGVLAMCIDHRELFRLGQMLNEVFDEENRIAVLNWQRTYTRSNDAGHVATTTEYVLVYARDIKKAKTALLSREGADDEGAMPDGDQRAWDDDPATGSNAKNHKSMVYAIQNPFSGEVLYPPPQSAWRYSQEQNLKWLRGWGCKFELKRLKDDAKRAELIGVPVAEVPDVKGILLAEPRETARKKSEAVYAKGPWPQFFFLKRGQGRPRVKKYRDQRKDGTVPTTYWASERFDVEGSVSWPHQESGHSQQGVDELTAVIGQGHEFKTVKPLKLFRRLIELWCPPGGVVLDPFAGSGTTGHAVLGLNVTDTARRFILIEQGRPERGDSYARSLTADRLRRVVSGDWAIGKQKPLQGGFRFVSLAKKVDAGALLRMERVEMVDTVIASYFDANRRRGSNLITIDNASAKYLVAKNADDEGFFLVWDGPNKNTDFTEVVYERCAQEAKKAGLCAIYHVYARLNLYQTGNVRFYQIPDRILADFGLDLRSEPFTEADT